jgi:hypothetical protein
MHDVDRFQHNEIQTKRYKETDGFMQVPEQPSLNQNMNI